MDAEGEAIDCREGRKEGGRAEEEEEEEEEEDDDDDDDGGGRESGRVGERATRRLMADGWVGPKAAWEKL